MKILQRIFYAISVVFWVLFNWAIRVNLFLNKSNPIRFWKYSPVLALFLKDNKFLAINRDNICEITVQNSELVVKLIDEFGNKAYAKFPIKEIK